MANLSEAPEGDLPPYSLSNLQVSSRSFRDPGLAKELGSCVGNVIGALSRYIDLERLDGVTIAVDYDPALAELDRGLETSTKPKASKDHGTLGIAMTLAVLRASVVKAHIVFSAPHVMPLLDSGHELNRDALYTVAHECAHVENLKEFDSALPNYLLQHIYPNEEAKVLGAAADLIWEEYAACRRSAHFASEHTLSGMDEALADAVDAAPQKADAAIKHYRMHGSLTKVIYEAGGWLVAPLKQAAYVLGHLHGVDASSNLAPRARDALSQSRYLALIGDMEAALQELWANRGAWPNWEAFTPIEAIIKRAYSDGGLVFLRNTDGSTHLDIPFTPQTLPTRLEAMQWQAARRSEATP